MSSAYNKFSFYDLIKLKLAEYCDNDFFLDNYAVPRTEDVTFEKKNNLIIILLESMSNHLHVSDETVSYIPQLESLYATYQHHEQLYNCRNTTWTIGALTSWCFGVPLNLPGSIDGNSYEAGNFLPNAASIFDILKKNDYSSWLFMGSSAQFAGTNYLFERGDYTVYDLEYFREKNKITEQNRSNWGLYDFFLYDEMYKKYLELREQNKPFVLFMQTIDTHAPGFAPKNKVHYGDIRDSWLNADDMLYAFLKKMAPFLETDNINILIFGDHIVMGEYDALNAQDSLFNLFAGKHIPQIPESKLTQNINPMDIAPTILQAAGAKWNNDQFGLGISIFSTEKSFSEREGREGLDEKLLYHSKFYDNFFKNGFDKFYGELHKALKENSVDFKKFYNEKGVTDEQAYIAHGSGVHEYTYTNSYEGLLDALQRGFKFIELDLLITTDNVIIGGHDWSYFKNLIGYPDDNDSPVSYEEIKNEKINKKYSVLSSKEICAVMKKYPDFYLVTDKIQNYSLLLKQIPFPERMIVEVFTLNDYYNALKAGIKYPALCVYTAEAAKNALNQGIPMLTGNAQMMADDPKLLEYMTKAHKEGTVIFLFGYGKTVSNRYFMKRFMGKAFSKYYVDRDYHKIIEENLK